MRIVASLFLLITLVVFLFFGYCYVGTEMEIVGIHPDIMPASEVPDTFHTIRHQLDINAFTGDVLYPELQLSDKPEDYAFLTLTVRMRNNGFLPQDYIRLQALNLSTDLLQLPAERTPSLNARTTADFQTTLLIPAENATAARGMRITYYVMGKPYEVALAAQN